MNENFYSWLREAITVIQSGVCKRVDKPDGTAKVYECGTIIRVDLKPGFEEGSFKSKI